MNINNIIHINNVSIICRWPHNFNHKKPAEQSQTHLTSQTSHTPSPHTPVTPYYTHSLTQSFCIFYHPLLELLRLFFPLMSFTCKGIWCSLTFDSFLRPFHKFISPQHISSYFPVTQFEKIKSLSHHLIPTTVIRELANDPFQPYHLYCPQSGLLMLTLNQVCYASASI